MRALDETDQKLFRENLMRTDMVHLSMLPEQANYLDGLLTALAPHIPRQGKDSFNIIHNWLEKALSYYEFYDPKEDDN